VVEKRSDDERWVDGNNVPFRVVSFDEFPCLSFGECFAGGIDEMSIWIADTFLPCRWIEILFLEISQANELHTL